MRAYIVRPPSAMWQTPPSHVEGGDDMADDEKGVGPPRRVHVVLRM